MTRQRLMVQRKIIHIDMDAFFAAVEQRDVPDYRGRPVIIGGDPDRRGVVAAASYEARRYGIHSAMPAAQARQRCPQAIFIRPRFAVYRAVSQVIRAIFYRYTPLVETLSLDEAYLDVTGSALHEGSATWIAQALKADIRRETGLIASAGVSYNKFLAKHASDLDKPDGLYIITPQAGPGFIETLPIGRFYGIGPATEARMRALGIHTGADLKHWAETALIEAFGKIGAHYYRLARGVDERPVEPHRERQSIGAEMTFAQDLDDVAVLQAHLEALAGKVAAALAETYRAGYTLTLKVKYADFRQVTRSLTVNPPLRTLDEIALWLPVLLARTEAGRRKVRLLGVTVANLTETSTPAQLALPL